ncbi:FAD-binding protein [Roseomonas chloroacetimidivorans]
MAGQIIVVGAGLGGLTAAIALRCWGFDVAPSSRAQLGGLAPVR